MIVRATGPGIRASHEHETAVRLTYMSRRVGAIAREIREIGPQAGGVAKEIAAARRCFVVGKFAEIAERFCILGKSEGRVGRIAEDNLPEEALTHEGEIVGPKGNERK